ncbi:hypothetical protein KR093_008808, partial [Drosophila rubida]
VVKPLLDYFRQIRNELDQSEAKEKQLTELNSNLMKKYHEIVQIHEKLMKQAFQLDEYNEKIVEKTNELQLCQIETSKLQSQIDIQKSTIDRLTSPFQNYDKCRDELAGVTRNLETCEAQLSNRTSILNQKDEIISKNVEKIQNITENFEKSQTKLLEKEKDNQLCEVEVKKLNSTLQYFKPSSCIPFGENPGVHQIKVGVVNVVDVLCNSQLAGPGWLVIQQRIGGKEDFNRDWAAYRKGFGSLDRDFFLGLETIHLLTSSQPHELYVHLVGSNGTIVYARYDDFKISDEENGYKLSLGKMSGTVKMDALRYGVDMKFSTFDRDNDEFINNCAKIYSSGWWYTNC